MISWRLKSLNHGTNWPLSNNLAFYCSVTFSKKCICTLKLQHKKYNISLHSSNVLDLKFGEHNMNKSQCLFERNNSPHSDDRD